MRTSLLCVLTLSLGLSACSKPAEPPAPASQPPAVPPATQPANPTAQPGPAPQTPAATPTADAPGTVPTSAAPATAAPASADAAATQTPAQAAHAEPARPATPPPPPPPQWKDVTLPAGTQLGLTLHTAVASDTSKVEDPVRATLRRDIVRDELTVLPAGTPLTGSVVAVERSGKVKGLASLSIRFTSLVIDDERYELTASSVSRQAESTKKKDATKVGIGTGAGAVIGAIVGGGKGAAIGAGVGAAGGTGYVMSTRGEEVKLASGTAVSITLSAPLTVRVLLHK
jgi:hypothetical protein